MRAVFRSNLKRRLFLDAYSLLVTASEPKHIASRNSGSRPPPDGGLPNITPDVRRCIDDSGIQEGLMLMNTKQI